MTPPTLITANCRPFSSGSRQPPDPIDQFLGQVGFYRKHTARDSTSLYRCVSEQLFDTQNYHDFVRHECITYMTRHRRLFEDSIDSKQFDQYLLDLAKPRAHGTLVELRALALLYGRNVLLFEPFNTGAWFVTHSDDDDDDEDSASEDDDDDDDDNESASSVGRKCLQLFFTSDGHFDTVYDQAYIEDAAFCQSLCYEIMYSYVFSLPDVMYAVERMLHDAPFDAAASRAANERTVAVVATSSSSSSAAQHQRHGASSAEYISMFSDGYPERMALDDGRVFLLDRPERTRCVLENYHMCHFHNSVHFERLSLELRRELWDSREPQQETRALRQLQAMLPDRYTSCVRQLLVLGITPFPYKVAKALDPSIYRNVEYDTWSEFRKEQRMRYMQNGHCFQVGARCLLRGQQSGGGPNAAAAAAAAAYHHSQAAPAPLVCHIQEVRPQQGKCFVFVEGLGEKRYVPMSALQCLEGGERGHHHHHPFGGHRAAGSGPSAAHRNHHHHGQQQQQQQNGYTYRNAVRSYHGGNAGVTSMAGANRSGRGGGQRALGAGTSNAVALLSTSTPKTTITVSASTSNGSSTAWVHNKGATNAGWTISNGGRRYGFTKNTCNHNKVAAALAQKHAEQQRQQRQKQLNAAAAATATINATSGSLFGDGALDDDETKASSACLKLFDLTDDEDDHRMLNGYAVQETTPDEKLLQFGDSILGGGGSGGGSRNHHHGKNHSARAEDDDLFSYHEHDDHHQFGKESSSSVAMQLSHLTSIAHFQPSIFEPIIAAPLIVNTAPHHHGGGGGGGVPTSAGNYRSAKPQNNGSYGKHSSNNNGAGLGRRKGMLANPTVTPAASSTLTASTHISGKSHHTNNNAQAQHSESTPPGGGSEPPKQHHHHQSSQHHHHHSSVQTTAASSDLAIDSIVSDAHHHAVLLDVHQQQHIGGGGNVSSSSTNTSSDPKDAMLASYANPFAGGPLQSTPYPVVFYPYDSTWNPGHPAAQQQQQPPYHFEQQPQQQQQAYIAAGPPPQPPSIGYGPAIRGGNPNNSGSSGSGRLTTYEVPMAAYPVPVAVTAYPDGTEAAPPNGWPPIPTGYYTTVAQPGPLSAGGAPPPPPPPPFFYEPAFVSPPSAGAGGGCSSSSGGGAGGLLTTASSNHSHYSTANTSAASSTLAALGGSAGFLSHNANAIPVRRRDLLEQQTAVNLDARPSYDPRGYDIATSADIGTMRFFYNLGHEYYRQLQGTFSAYALAQLTRAPPAGEEGHRAGGHSSSNSSSGAVATANSNGAGDSSVDAVVGKMGKMKLDGGRRAGGLNGGNHKGAAGAGNGSGEGRRYGGGGGAAARNSATAATSSSQRRNGGGYMRNSAAAAAAAAAVESGALKSSISAAGGAGNNDSTNKRTTTNTPQSTPGKEPHYYHQQHHHHYHSGEPFESTARYPNASGHSVPLLSTPVPYASSSGHSEMATTMPTTAAAPPPPPPAVGSAPAVGQYVSMGPQYAQYYPQYYSLDEAQYYYDQQIYMQMQYGMYPSGYATAFAPYGPPPQQAALAPMPPHAQSTPNSLVPIDATTSTASSAVPIGASPTPAPQREQQEHNCPSSSVVDMANNNDGASANGDASLDTSHNIVAASTPQDLSAVVASVSTSATTTSTDAAISSCGSAVDMLEEQQHPFNNTEEANHQQQQQHTATAAVPSEHGDHITAFAPVSPFLSPSNAPQYFYGQPNTPVAMAPQGYWYPPPNVVALSPSAHLPVPTASCEQPSGVQQQQQQQQPPNAGGNATNAPHPEQH